MIRPDYSQFNLEQLQDALQQIDKEQYPEDTKLISALIQAENIHTSHKPDKFFQKGKFSLNKKFSFWTHLITASLLFALALYIHFANKIPVLNIPLNLAGAEFTKLALVLSCTGSGIISLFHFVKECMESKK